MNKDKQVSPGGQEKTGLDRCFSGAHGPISPYSLLPVSFPLHPTPYFRSLAPDYSDEQDN